MFRNCIFLLLLLSTSLPGQQINFGWSPPPKGVVYSSSNHKIRINNLIENDDLKGDADAYLLYRELYLSLKEKGKLSASELESGRLNSLDQGQVGACVGYGTTIALDITACYNERMRAELRQIALARFNPDAIYAIGRADNLGRSDGSTGFWSMKGISNIGTLHKMAYPGGVDLRNTTPQHGRKWSADGLPSGYKDLASKRKVLSYEKVINIEQAKKLLKNGYCVILCAQASYPSARDSDGFSKLNGRNWAHCMCVVAYRNANTGREGFLIQNSWNNNWNGGPIWPNDQPHGSFWVSAKDLMVHLSQGDSYAIGDYNGFPRKIITWRAVFNVNRKVKE